MKVMIKLKPDFLTLMILEVMETMISMEINKRIMISMNLKITRKSHNNTKIKTVRKNEQNLLGVEYYLIHKSLCRFK